MTHPKPSSSFRYFLSSLKPLGRPTVWASLGTITLIAVTIWQYSQNPEWLSNELSLSDTSNVEDEVRNNLDIGGDLQNFDANSLEAPLSSDPFNSTLSQPTTELSLDNPYNPSETETLPLPTGLSSSPIQSTSEQEESSNQKQLIKFQPLMPNVKELGSLFPSIKPAKNESKPIKLPDLQPLDPAASQDNPLKNALDNVLAEESLNNSELTPAPRESDFSESSIEEQSPTNSDAPSAARRPLQTYTQPNNNPYGRVGAQPYARPNNNPYGGAGNQPYARPNNNPYGGAGNQAYTQPYPNPYGNGVAPVPVPAYPQPSQLGNTPNTDLNPNPYGQGDQGPIEDDYGMQEPQVSPYEGQYSY